MGWCISSLTPVISLSPTFFLSASFSLLCSLPTFILYLSSTCSFRLLVSTSLELQPAASAFMVPTLPSSSWFDFSFFFNGFSLPVLSAFIPTAFIFPFPKSDVWKQESDRSGDCWLLIGWLALVLVWLLALGGGVFSFGDTSRTQGTDQPMSFASLGLVSPQVPASCPRAPFSSWTVVEPFHLEGAVRIAIPVTDMPVLFFDLPAGNHPLLIHVPGHSQRMLLLYTSLGSLKTVTFV